METLYNVSPPRRGRPPKSIAPVKEVDAATLSRYVNSEQASTVLGLKRQTLAKMRMTGKGPEFVKFGPRCVRYKFGDLIKWAESQRAPRAQ
jgi:predicted DNA-binding transcriptional regulator AlpA